MYEVAKELYDEFYTERLGRVPQLPDVVDFRTYDLPEHLFPESVQLLYKILTAVAVADGAMTGKSERKSPTKTGGIDLTASKMDLQLQRSEKGIVLKIDPAMLEQLRNASGLAPGEVYIRPLENLRTFLGLPEK